MKHKGPNKKSKLLCRPCNDLIQVSSVETDVAILACGHTRTCGLLELEPGRISIEHLQSSIGKKLFPANRENEATSLLPFNEKTYLDE